MDILTNQQTIPPRHIEIDGSIWPVSVLVDREEWAILANAGIYRHVTEDGDKGHARYSEWTLSNDANGPFYTRYPIADVTADGIAPFGYTDWEQRTDENGRIYYYREPAGTEEERRIAANQRTWQAQHIVRERKRLQAIINAPDDAYPMSERVSALQQIQQLGV